jgi:hypothetical protein
MIIRFDYSTSRPHGVTKVGSGVKTSGPHWPRNVLLFSLNLLILHQNLYGTINALKFSILRESRQDGRRLKVQEE